MQIDKERLMIRFLYFYTVCKNAFGDIITGFDYCADDYHYFKPFEFSVLLSRMRALIRRNLSMEENIITGFH